jgi:hypothetical protein
MKKRVHIVASCADRKVVAVPKERRLGSYRSHASVSRFESFVRALRAASGETRAARDLYAGPYWSVVRDLPDVAAAAGVEAKLWVASAGYGLVPGDVALHGYSATFRSGVADSVPTRIDADPFPKQLTAWWKALSTWHGPSRGTPRSLHRLAEKEGDTIVVLASPRYVQAMADDLRGAAEVLGDQLLIVTSHDPGPDDALAANVVPSQESLIRHVAGARPALHARVARHILEHVGEHPLSARALRARYTRLVNSSDYARPPDRQPMTDQEVRRFIRRQLGADPDLTHSRLLRVLRDRGRACEQTRFRSLFREEAGDAR